MAEIVGLIPFTHYTLPHGRRIEESFKCDNAETLALAHKIINRGGRFTVELLRTGHASLAVEAEVEGEGSQDIACVVCKNGPPLVAAIDELVREAWKWMEEWMEEESPAP